VVHEVEGASLVTVGTVAAICEEAEGREAVSGTGGGKAGSSEVDVPSTGLDAVVESLAGGVQLTDAFRVGPVSGHISGDPPIGEFLAPVDKEGEDFVGPAEQLAEPLREGLEREVLLSFAGVIGESVEGVRVDLSVVPSESSHGPLCIGGVERGDPDVPGSGTMSVVRDEKGRESSLVIDEVDGASIVAEGDGGGSGLSSDSSDLGFKVGSELVVDRRAVVEGVGEVLGDLFEVVVREAPAL
jgi:hypothetical protein